MHKVKVSVLGAGNGGLATAGVLAINGYSVVLYEIPEYEENIRTIKKHGGVTLNGKISGFGMMKGVTTDIEEAVAYADIIIIVTPAYAHRKMGKLCEPHLKNGQIVVLHPGRPGGALDFMTSVKIPEGLIVAEMQTLIFAVRKLSSFMKIGSIDMANAVSDQVFIFGVKKNVQIATIPSTKAREVISKLRNAFPNLIPAESVLETSLNDVGAIFHPLPSLVNLARIESGQRFMHYYEGITKSVASLMAALDNERVNVGKSLDVKVMTAVDWLREVYGTVSDNLFEGLHKCEVYAFSEAPTNSIPEYPYFLDVPYELVPISSIGSLTGTSTPCIDAVITLISTLHGKDYRDVGRNAGKMGIEGLTKAEIVKRAKEGLAI